MLNLKPGRLISENSLCTKYNVSRTPIRAVLSRLAGAGLVDIIPKSGSRVSMINMEIVKQIIYERFALESMVLKDYIRIATDSDIKKLEKYIKSTGFYKNKAKNIKLNAEALLKKHNDVIPDRMEELVELPGVGRKTANVVLGEIWDIREGIVVDTHVKRLSNHIGFVKSENPEIIERELMKFVPKKNWFEYSHYLILHGRDKCKARKPQCEMCEINEYCKYYEKLLKEVKKRGEGSVKIKKTKKVKK